MGNHPTALPTLFSSHRHVERYVHLLSARLAGSCAPRVAIGAIDAFIVQELTASSPASSVAVDLAGNATLGASVVLWGGQPSIRRVLVAEDVAWPAGDSAWRTHLASLLDELEIHSPAGRIRFDADSPLRERCKDSTSVLAPPLLWVSVAVVGEDPERIGSHLEQLTALHPNVVLLLFPLGALGESAPIEAALRLCRARALKFAAIRELSPFFASSQLGIICRSDNAIVAEGLRRIQRMYEGNFDFLDLLATVVRDAAECAALERELNTARATINAMHIKFVSPLVVELRRHRQQFREEGLDHILQLMKRLGRKRA